MLEFAKHRIVTWMVYYQREDWCQDETQQTKNIERRKRKYCWYLGVDLNQGNILKLLSQR